MGKNLKGKELGTGLSQRSDGRYMARFQSRSGKKRVTKYFTKLPDAKAWLRQAQYDDEHSNIAASSNMTVDTWFDVWFEVKRNQCRKSTYERYENHYKLHIQPYIGNMTLSDVRPVHCQNIINEISRTMKASSVQLIKIELSAIFQYAVDNSLISNSPVKVQLPRKEKQERKVLTQKEEGLFLDMAKASPYYFEYAFVLQTGLRCGEIRGLKWSDIDFKNRSISIFRSVDYDKDAKRFVENPVKTEYGKRLIPMTKQAHDILIEQKKKNEGKPTVLGYHEYVFLNSKGKPTHKKYMTGH